MANGFSGRLDECVDGKYRLIKKISPDFDAYVYLGEDIISGKQVAIKLELIKSVHSALEREFKIYKTLAGGLGVPPAIWFGVAGDHNAMVLDLLGPSLEDLLSICGGKFSLKTVLLLADQMISRIEYVHSRNIIHRGIKPANFCMGDGKLKHMVNIIDFGSSKVFRDSNSWHHAWRENRSLVGNVFFASVNSHLGIEQARRDDLESLAFIFIYFLRGGLPWKNAKPRPGQKMLDCIFERKFLSLPDVLCRDLPPEFGRFLQCARGISFIEKPNYSYYRKLFRDLFNREGYQCDHFDWCYTGTTNELDQL